MIINDNQEIMKIEDFIQKGIIVVKEQKEKLKKEVKEWKKKKKK